MVGYRLHAHAHAHTHIRIPTSLRAKATRPVATTTAAQTSPESGVTRLAQGGVGAGVLMAKTRWRKVYQRVKSYRSNLSGNIE